MSRAGGTFDGRGATGLDIHLLGPVGAERDGEPVSLGGPPQRAVLARLAIAAGQIVPVDRLVADVWAGEPPLTAVNTLQSYVSLLRRALGDPRHLRREGPGYVLTVSREQIDATRFEDRVAAGRAAIASAPDAALVELDAAVDEWHGRALGDFADEEWARPAAVRWEELRLAALDARADAVLALARHGDAVGERAVTPPHEVSAASRPDVIVAEVATDSPGDPGPEPSPVPLPGPALRCGITDFVGRTAQLAALHRIWNGVLTGHSHLALVVGEAGAGKSRLAARFAAEVHEQGAVVLWGRATAEAIVPFEPMVEAIRTALRTISPEARRRVAGERGHLALLLPELEQLVPEVRAAPAEPSVERYLLFESVAEVLRSESAGYPLLIVLDDLHWADAPSLKLVEHVLRHEQPGRVMVLGAARAPADAPTPELDQLAIDLGRDRLLSRVVVNGLATNDVGDLLRAGGRDAELAGELHTATGGNAFFLTELIRHGNGSPLGGELPESIRAMVGVRLDRLDRTVTHVLNLTAIAGPAATLPVLERASGLDGDRLLDAVDTALAAAAHGEVAVEPLDPRLRQRRLHRLHDLLRPVAGEAEVLALAHAAGPRRRGLVAAVVALHVAAPLVEREQHGAVRARRLHAALAAHQRRRVAAAVQEQERLLLAREPRLQRLAQRRGEDRIAAGRGASRGGRSPRPSACPGCRSARAARAAGTSPSARSRTTPPTASRSRGRRARPRGRPRITATSRAW